MHAHSCTICRQHSKYITVHSTTQGTHIEKHTGTHTANCAEPMTEDSWAHVHTLHTTLWTMHNTHWILHTVQNIPNCTLSFPVQPPPEVLPLPALLPYLASQYLLWAVWTILCTVQIWCTLYCVLCILYFFLCKLYSVLYKLQCVLCKLYFVLRKL